ncbi:MAG: hypothetical protein HZA91_15790 [Verrucomicrobia bacterium]|nr:hypothetical protein [Verrucomicrobiota bacterium]
MNPDNKPVATIIRWLARLASLASLGMILAFFIGEGFDLRRLASRDWELFAFFPLGVCAGMVLAWWREGWGGCVTVVSVMAFYVVHFAVSGKLPRGPWFAIFASPGALFLLSSLLRHHWNTKSNPTGETPCPFKP